MLLSFIWALQCVAAPVLPIDRHRHVMHQLEDTRAAANSTSAQQQTLCLLPLGDSISQGNAKHESWHAPLWRRLIDLHGEAVSIR